MLYTEVGNFVLTKTVLVKSGTLGQVIRTIFSSFLLTESTAISSTAIFITKVFFTLLHTIIGLPKYKGSVTAYDHNESHQSSQSAPHFSFVQHTPHFMSLSKLWLVEHQLSPCFCGVVKGTHEK